MASVLFELFLPFFGQLAEQALLSSTRDRQLARQVEELRATYTADELRDNWEFKVLSAECDDIASNQRRQQILNVELKAGWTLVEVLDSSRIRLKRPENAKANDHLIDFDAYRTFVGVGPMSKGLGGALAIGAVICLTLLTIRLYAS